LKRTLFAVFTGFTLLIISSSGALAAALPVEITTSKEDTEYLRGIMKDAFNSIYFFRNPHTGLFSDFPDGSNPGELVITENIFLSMTSVAIAGKIGLIPEAEAVKETDRTLASIENLKRNWGFFRKLYRPIDCSTESGANASGSLYSMSDYGWNTAALAVVGELYPRFRKRTDKLLKETQWSRLYKPELGTIHALLNFQDDGTLKTWGPINDISNDCRTAVFMAIASGQVPPEVWTHMKSEEFKRYGITYFGFAERLGYGEQPWGLGYYLDERGSRYGMSNANLAWVQMLYAADMEFPAWGWSSCQGMNGYMGWGNRDTDWSRVNTHAVAAAVAMYPNQVVKALRIMEKLGLRKPVVTRDGVQHDFGLKDSIDLDTGDVPDYMIVGLDQNIVFLSIANYLYDGIVWKYFAKNATVKHGISVIDDYAKPHKEYLEIYKRRDLTGPPIPVKKRPGELLADDFSGEMNNLGGERKTYSSDISVSGGKAALSFYIMNDQMSSLTEKLNDADLTDYNALKLVMRSGEPGSFMVTMRLGGEGGYRQVFVEKEWRELIIPFRAFLNGKYSIESNGNKGFTAMWHNRRGQDIDIGPVNSGTLEIKKISFLSLTPEQAHSVILKLKQQ
jgi:hypothetical protein